METIVIVGGGAGGLELATRLGDGCAKRGAARVVLVDRWPSHFWKPLLHTVASGARDPRVSQLDYSAQAAEHGFEFVRGEMVALDRQARTLTLAPVLGERGETVLPQRAMPYDKLVLALGAVTNFFGVDGAASHALTLDDVDQAEAFRVRFMGACIAEGSKAPDERRGLDIVIVGGGATGVELAAELRHSARTLARYHVHALDVERDVRIKIVERGPLLLPHLHARQSRRAARQLRAMGVAVHTNTAVASVAGDHVRDGDGAIHRADLTLWAAGVEGPALCAGLGLAVNRMRQLAVGPTLQVLGEQAIFAMGDCAGLVSPATGAVPPRAQVAHQQALFLAQALALPANAALPVFSFRDYGSLVSLGPVTAVGVLIGNGNRLQVGGATARLLYALMYTKHLLALHGFVRMAAHTVADWLRARLTPAVRLH